MTVGLPCGTSELCYGRRKPRADPLGVRWAGMWAETLAMAWLPAEL